MTSRAKPALYRNVAATSWTGETARAVKRRGGSDGLLVMQYLMTGPYTTMLGVYRLVVGYMGAETALGDAGAAKGLRACIDAGFCSYDEESEFIFVHEFAKWQIGADLLPLDKRCKGVQTAYEGLPDNPFLAAFFDRYSQSFHMTKRRSPRIGDAPPVDLFGPIRISPSEAPSMPDTRYQEQIPGTGAGPLAGQGGAGGTAPPPPAAPAPKPAKAPKMAKSKASKRVPEEWLVSVDLQRWAREKAAGVDIRAETEAFRDCEFTKAHEDWDATWRTWMRKAAKDLLRPAGNRGPSTSSLLQSAAERLAETQRLLGIAPTSHQETIDG